MDSGKSRKTSVSAPTSNVTTSSSTTKGVQKFYTKIRHKIEDLPPKITAKLHKNSKRSTAATLSPVGKFTSLSASSKLKPKSQPQRLVTKSVQTSPIKDSRKTSPPSVNKVKTPLPQQQDSVYEKIEVVSTNPKGGIATVYVDSDEECRLSMNDSKISLEDEIFEELEKVAHDEAKLNAVLKNFDKILADFNQDKQTKANEFRSLDVALPTVIHSTTTPPQKLQKSKTCSIIESRCILKKSISEEKDDTDNLTVKMDKQANFNVTKSLWNLKDFEEFAKSGRKFEKLENCKLPVYTGITSPSKSVCSASSTPVKVPSLRSKSVWELSGSVQSISASRSRIPIMKSSSIKSLNSRSNSFCDVQNTQKARSPPNVSKIIKNINEKSVNSSKPSFSRTTSSLAVSTSKVSPTVSNQRRRSLITSVSTPHSLNKLGSSPQNRTSSKPKSNAIETSSRKSASSVTNKCATLRKQKSSDVLLDKCIEKGNEILRKVESIGNVTRLDTKTRTTSGNAKKPFVTSPRSYAKIKEQGNARAAKERNSKSAANKLANKPNNSSANSNSSKEVKNTKPSTNTVDIIQLPSNDQIITNQDTIDEPQQSLLYAKEETIKFPRLESCKIIPPVLGSTSDEHTELLVSVKTKQPEIKPTQVATTKLLIDRICNNQYTDSDHDSDDSGHISNENDEPLTIITGVECASSRGSSDKSNGSCNDVNSLQTGLPSTVVHQRITASTKISELLEKFEHSATINSNNNIIHHQRQHHQLQTPSKKICTALKIAQVEPVKCIQTHIEIYPTYSKEVILRLL